MCTSARTSHMGATISKPSSHAEAPIPGGSSSPQVDTTSKSPGDLIERETMKTGKGTPIPQALRRQIIEEMLAPITNPMMRVEFQKYADEYITARFTSVDCTLRGYYHELAYWISKSESLARVMRSLGNIGGFDVERMFSIDMTMGIRMGTSNPGDEGDLLSPREEMLEMLQMNNVAELPHGSSVPTTGKTYHIPDEPVQKIDGGHEPSSALPKTGGQTLEELQHAGAQD
jgi:hypothetical protein